METVPDEAVIGVLTSFNRKGKLIDVNNRNYRFYARFWNLIYPVRHLFVRIRGKAKRVLKRLVIKGDQ